MGLLRNLYNFFFRPDEYDLDRAAKNSGEDLDWRLSIVDYLKTTGQDSSFAARKRLWQQYGYEGEYKGTESQNIMLHRKLMGK